MTSSEPFRQDLMEMAAAHGQYAVLVTTPDLQLPGPKILYVNDAFTLMTGYSADQVIGKTPRILQGPKTDRTMLERLRNALSAGEDFIARAINYKRDGSEFEMEWIINHVRDATGATTHYVASQRDITALKHVRRELALIDGELRVAGEQLLSTMRKLEAAERRVMQQERLAALGRMAEGVVHDLGNSLAPIAMFVEVLKTVEGLPPVVQESIEGIGASARHGLSLLANLDSFRGGRAPSATMEAVDLHEIVERVQEIVRPQIEQMDRQSRRVRIQLDIAPVPKIHGNVVELTQVLVNLVANAIDAMTDAGLVTIRLAQQADNVILTVSDTGPGIPPDLVDRCFEPYVTSKPGGSGLGLSVCLGIVRRHQGDISVENSGPTGSAVFTIRLPVGGVSNVVPS